MRIQCKWAKRVGAVPFYSNRRTRNGLSRRVYTAAEIDAVAAYCPELERCYFLPYARFDGRTQVQLRVAPSRNNQRLGVDWADDFAFESLHFLEIEGP